MLKHLLVSKLQAIQEKFGLNDWEFTQELFECYGKCEGEESTAQIYYENLMDKNARHPDDCLKPVNYNVLRESFKLSEEEMEELKAYSSEVDQYLFPVDYLSLDQMFLIYFLTKKSLDSDTLLSIFQTINAKNKG